MAALRLSGAADSAAERIRPLPSHVLLLHDEPAVLRPTPGGTAYESAVVEARFPFDEALISWNVYVPDGSGFSVELRVGRSCGSWSPYLYVDDWGDVPSGIERRKRWEGGRIDVDYFRSDSKFERIQYRLSAFGKAGAEGSMRIRRVALVLSDMDGRAPAGPDGGEPPEREWKRALDVPPRSQKVEPPEIAGRVCSPTCLAMVLEYRGVRRSTREVAERAYDPHHGIYGNWPRAIQAAYSYGVPGYVARFSRWSDVRREIARGQPLVISIGAKKGQLTGAPYEATEGHLLVLLGFDDKGDVVVNDPAAPSAEECRRTYAAKEIEEVWLRRGGTAYVLLARE